MPTLPLFELPKVEPGVPPHVSHRVRAPGGYEWWHFDARDAGAGDVRVQIDLFAGDPFNRAYRRAYARYRRRPTRVTPPVPGDYPNLTATVFSKGEQICRVA